MDATLYRADGTIENITPENGKDFKLAELYKLLGCRTIEVICTGDPAMIFIGDDEAQLMDDCVKNETATRIYREGNGIFDAAHEWAEAKANAPENFIFIEPEAGHEPYTIYGDVIYCPSVMLK